MSSVKLTPTKPSLGQKPKPACLRKTADAAEPPPSLNKVAPPPKTTEVSIEKNIFDEVFKGPSIEVAALANKRPIITFHLAVDDISFLIGGVGGIAMGYLLDQYESPDFDVEAFSGIEFRTIPVVDILSHIISNPKNIIKRFFFAGTLYVASGLFARRMGISMEGMGRPFVCGSLTGLLLSRGGTLKQIWKNTFGFAAFAISTELASKFWY